MTDYVDELLGQVSGDDDDELLDEAIEGLEGVGLTEVGRAAAKRTAKQALALVKRQRANRRRAMNVPPSPPFARSDRSTLRRAPLGFINDSGGFGFALAAAVNATTTMRAKVSRVFHPDRLLIVPSAPGVVLDSIRIGDEEQLASPGAPVELYGTAALTDSEPDNFSPAQTGIDVLIILRNTTAGAITGTIGMKGGVER